MRLVNDLGAKLRVLAATIAAIHPLVAAEAAADAIQIIGFQAHPARGGIADVAVNHRGPIVVADTRHAKEAGRSLRALADLTRH